MLEKVKKVAAVRHLLFCFVTFILCACQSQGVIRVTSQPEGAYITPIKGYGAGVAPLMLNVHLDENRDRPDANGCYEVWGVTAQWVSGASVTQEKIKLCNGPKSYYTFVMVRPQNAPNLNADLNYALQLQSQKNASDRASAARAAAALGGMAAGLNAMQTPRPQTNTNTYIMPGGKMMNCTTTGSVTNCY